MITNFEIKRNIMGTVSLNMKIKGMRKHQDFIFYPVTEESNFFIIQSKTRIGKINLEGQGFMTQAHQSGAYFHHFNIDTLKSFGFSSRDWETIKEAIKKTASSSAGKKENGIIQSNNSGAKSIFEL
jgi:hypothetical protein